MTRLVVFMRIWKKKMTEMKRVSERALKILTPCGRADMSISRRHVGECTLAIEVGLPFYDLKP